MARSMNVARRFECMIVMAYFFLNVQFLANAKVRRVVVVGGGAAGYFAAIECANILSQRYKFDHEVRGIICFLKSHENDVDITRSS